MLTSGSYEKHPYMRWKKHTLSERAKTVNMRGTSVRFRNNKTKFTIVQITVQKFFNRSPKCCMRNPGLKIDTQKKEIRPENIIKKQK
jgi:hypothetical protein